jgi:hypothetical protein
MQYIIFILLLMIAEKVGVPTVEWLVTSFVFFVIFMIVEHIGRK